ncbi:MAG: PhnD/SsuA/transferrin family substrate-binding protein [Thermodesulfovibrionales bacterium]|nr:PhnD/SsuA/transferrin family substrate-binding protein [Thermodesulfovibrionales bacterium]
MKIKLRRKDKRFLIIVTVVFITTLVITSIPYAKEKCLIMGLIPAEDPKTMIEKYRPMKDFLEREVGQCIQLFTATDYTGVIEAIRAKRLILHGLVPFLMF